ncbi:hypothetical protein pb186bvf_002074 [Paramecium bursaria]
MIFLNYQSNTSKQLYRLINYDNEKLQQDDENNFINYRFQLFYYIK